MFFQVLTEDDLPVSGAAIRVIDPSDADNVVDVALLSGSAILAAMRKQFWTQRFILRPLRLGDSTWMVALYSDPDVTRFLPEGPWTPQEALRVADEYIHADLCSPRLGRWAIEDPANAQVHGIVSLTKQDIIALNDDIQLGVLLQKQSWGQKIAPEAAARLLEYGFCELGLERIVAVTRQDNTAAQRLLDKLGLQMERLGLQMERHSPLARFTWRYSSLSRLDWERRH